MSTPLVRAAAGAAGSAASSAMRLIRRAITESTRVTFPRGATRTESRVIDVAEMVGGKAALLLAATSFHPVDRTWPDQPADRGTLQLKTAGRFPVTSCEIFAAHRETQELREAAQVPKKERSNWFSLVAHVIDPQEKPLESFIGEEVTAEVDAPYREALNRHHTACHLAAVALNRATHSFWTKEGAKKDSLGSFNLDAEAMDTSLIFEDRSEDVYRFGKSIKKAGLQVDQLFADRERVQAEVNAFLNAWITHGAPVVIESTGEGLDDTRMWTSTLPDGRAVRMPCGGSHMANVAELGRIEYRLEELVVDGEKKLKATTKTFPPIRA